MARSSPARDDFGRPWRRDARLRFYYATGMDPGDLYGMSPPSGGVSEIRREMPRLGLSPPASTLPRASVESRENTQLGKPTHKPDHDFPTHRCRFHLRWASTTAAFNRAPSPGVWGIRMAPSLLVRSCGSRSSARHDTSAVANSSQTAFDIVAKICALTNVLMGPLGLCGAMPIPAMLAACPISSMDPTPPQCLTSGNK